jgi:predicted TPR repeat methyltransferase
MAVGDHGALDRAHRVDMKAAGLAAQAGWYWHQDVLWAHLSYIGCGRAGSSLSAGCDVSSDRSVPKMSSRVFMSSGDLVADRRFDYARDLQLRGELVAAEDLFVQAIDLAPGFATAWFTLGEVREQLGDLCGAVTAFRRAQASDLGDRNGAGLRLMRLGADALSAMPAPYVTALFDQYAETFDAALVGDLGYRGPDVLLRAILAVREAAGQPLFFPCAIDLGCGTGLAAHAFAPYTGAIIGIDLSPRMIARAGLTGLYTELEVAEVAIGLSHRPDASVDLVLGADVMVYLHDIAPVLREVARVLKPGGVLAFTTETHDGLGVVLVQGLRYAHAAEYLRDAIAAAGLSLDRLASASSRTERGIPAPGLVVVATKP